MTKKRFVFDPSIYHFTDTKTGKKYCEYNLDEVVELLNNLYENNQIKSDISKILFALAFATFEDIKMGKSEIEAIERLQEYIGEKIIDLEKLQKRGQ